MVVQSKADWLGEQNSDARRKPKKAVVKAAHSIFWSYNVKCEVRKVFFNAFNNGNVIGCRLGLERAPFSLFIPLRSNLNSGISGVGRKPSSRCRNLIEERYVHIVA